MFRRVRKPLGVTLLCWVAMSFFWLPGTRAQEAAGQDAAAAAPQADAQPDAAQAKPKETYFSWFIRSSGLIGLFILMLSIYFLATVIRLFLEVRVDVAVPVDFLQQCEEFTRKNELQAVYTMVQNNDSNISHILQAGLSELPHGLSEAREAMDRMNEAETVRLEKQISMLAVLGTLGPMIGLIGTLKGMISSFSVIAMSDVQLKASEVASGISEALLLTFEGVALSVPAIYFHALFRNRVSTISANMMVHADRLLRQIARAARMTEPVGAVLPTAAPMGPPPVPGQHDRARAATPTNRPKG